VSGNYLNPPLLGMTLNKNVLKNIGGEITHGILLNGDAQKIKVITGGVITCPRRVPPEVIGDYTAIGNRPVVAGLDYNDEYFA
jgi:hypothetical protein